jgi:hypothetical protein
LLILPGIEVAALDVAGDDECLHVLAVERYELGAENGTALSSLPAGCAPRGDLAIRRSIERVVFEVRTEICQSLHQARGRTGQAAAR